MGIPPKSREQLSDIIRALLQLALAGILVSIGLPALFILLHVLTWPSGGKKDREAKQNIAMVNKIQHSKIKDDEMFAKTFDELAIGTLQGSHTANSLKFEYKIDVQSKNLAIIGAKPIDRETNGFNGAVLRYEHRKGFFVASSIICESAVAGLDGTERANLPVMNASGKLSCAPNWKVLQEDNEAQSDQKLVELIQDKSRDEITRVLNEQYSAYYKQKKFVDRYSDVPKKKIDIHLNST